MFESAVFSPT
jgi:hypothetical protein